MFWTQYKGKALNFYQSYCRRKSCPFSIIFRLLAAVPVQVEDKLYLLFFPDFLDKRFDCEDFGLKLGVGLFPAAVEVEARKVSPVVAKGYSVDIDHRDHIDVVSPKDKIGLLGVPEELEEHFFSYVRSYSLPWVLPC